MLLKRCTYKLFYHLLLPVKGLPPQKKTHGLLGAPQKKQCWFWEVILAFIFPGKGLPTPKKNNGLGIPYPKKRMVLGCNYTFLRMMLFCGHNVTLVPPSLQEIQNSEKHFPSHQKFKFQGCRGHATGPKEPPNQEIHCAKKH